MRGLLPLSLIAGLALLRPAGADVVVNEIHYAPDPKTARHEFVELFNAGASAVDLGGWTLSGGVDFVFPAGTLLEAGAYLLLAEDPAALAPAFLPTPPSGGAPYDFSSVPNASGFPGIVLAGQDGWVQPSGGTGITARNDIDSVPGFSGKNAYHSGTAAYATRRNNAAFGYAIPASATSLTLSLVGRINASATTALGPGVDANNNGSINAANGAGEYGFEFGCSGNAWFIREAAQGAVTSGPGLGFSGTGRSWSMELRVDLAANGGDGAGSLFVRQLGDTSNNPITDTLQPVPSLQNIPLGIQRMAALGGSAAPSSWNGLLTRLGGGNIDALALTWSSGGGSAPAPVLAFSGRLDNDGERVVLRDAGAAVRDEVDYRSEFPWPIAADGDGASMQLIHPGLDNDLAGSWRSAPPTPGAVNAVYAANAPPQLRQVGHLPKSPSSSEPVTVTVKATDPDGVGEVILLYQSVTPGDFIPAYFPLTYSQLTANPSTPRSPNPAFENPANWTSVTMRDDGTNGDVAAGDGIFAGAIPARPNRTLLRYRIRATDTLGTSVRVPYADDPSLNFACYVYDGVPAYTAATRSLHPDGAGHVHPAEVLNALPVHTLITRYADLRACNAHAATGDSGQQIPKSNTAARSAFNWEGAFVHEGIVYDHINYRLRQSNDRYAGDGKRSMRFRFNDGHYLQARDHEGMKVGDKWKSINTGKMSRFGSANVYGIREVVNARLWRLFGVDMPHYYHAHFRVVDGAEEAPTGANGQYLGDFWGLAMFYEDFEGTFLSNRGLPDGNVYKWKDGVTNALALREFQARDAVTDGSDFSAILNQLRPERDAAWLRQRVDWDQWYRYHGICDAIRHYDFGVTSGHLKNRGWYFMPAEGSPLGLLRHIPHDHDATWFRGYHDGLSVGIGVDFPMQAIYGYNGTTEKPEFTREYRNVLRELRDLLWTEEAVHDMIDRTVAGISAFTLADRDRWLAGPAAAGYESSMPAIETVAAEMKNFAFVTDTVNGSALAGGRGAYLDQLAHDPGIPGTPLLTHAGAAGYPANDVRLLASTYLAGAAPAAAIEWRLAEITDPAAPAFDPLALPSYEITATWQARREAPFPDEIAVPAFALRPGHSYRARARHIDSAGRAGHWSAPLPFTASEPDAEGYRSALAISEFLYRPAPATPVESAAGFSTEDFEWVEVRNTGAQPLDLTGVRFTKGVNFDFPDGWVIPAKGHALVVRNLEAFRLRHGTGLDFLIAGSYGDDNLSNEGERLKLSLGAGTAIRDFNYDDAPPWPEADDTGFSLVLVAPDSDPDHGLPGNWRRSMIIGGSPGGSDAIPFAGDPFGDSDQDGWNDLIGYALGERPRIQAAGSGDGFTVTVSRVPNADDAEITGEASTDLLDWIPADTANASGDTLAFRVPAPLSGHARVFLRASVRLR